MMDIVSVGEVLIDLTQCGLSPLGIPEFRAFPGGAPANLAVAAARLGAHTAFVGKVGNDSFGAFLKNILAQNGVDVSGLASDPQERTTLAVVSIDPAGERSFSFYRNPSADINLRSDELPNSLLQNTRFLHFGSVSLTDEPARSATLAAAKIARSAGALVSYDPNYRANLWNSEKVAVQQMRAALPFCDIIKLSNEELPLLTDSTNPLQGALSLHKLGIKLVFVTLGAEGAFFSSPHGHGFVPGVHVHVADTNGAGDTFFGAALSKLSQHPLDILSTDALREIVAFANLAASITTSRHGAIPAMPSLEEMQNLK